MNVDVQYMWVITLTKVDKMLCFHIFNIKKSVYFIKMLTMAGYDK